MAYKQPRVPEYRESAGASSYLRALVLFLKDFSQSAWNADCQREKSVDDMSSTLRSADHFAGVQKGKWNGNTPCGEIPNGYSYTESPSNGKELGFPANYATCMSLRYSDHRCYQLAVEKTNARAYVRSSTDGATWGEWKTLHTSDHANAALDAYPVGSIYLSVDATSPASLFGGTWEQLKDRFLLGAGDSYASGATGGASAVALTASQMPAHVHYVGIGTAEGGSTVLPSYTVVMQDGCYASPSKETTHMVSKTTVQGGGASHTNMPPYLAVYMWKRVS